MQISNKWKVGVEIPIELNVRKLTLFCEILKMCYEGCFEHSLIDMVYLENTMMPSNLEYLNLAS